MPIRHTSLPWLQLMRNIPAAAYKFGSYEEFSFTYQADLDSWLVIVTFGGSPEMIRSAHLEEWVDWDLVIECDPDPRIEVRDRETRLSRVFRGTWSQLQLLAGVSAVGGGKG